MQPGLLVASSRGAYSAPIQLPRLPVLREVQFLQVEAFSSCLPQPPSSLLPSARGWVTLGTLPELKAIATDPAQYPQDLPPAEAGSVVLLLSSLCSAQWAGRWTSG